MIVRRADDFYKESFVSDISLFLGKVDLVSQAQGHAL